MRNVRSGAHGRRVRGLTNVEAPEGFGARFSRVFPESSQMPEVSDEALLELAKQMEAAPEDAEDGPDPQESDIPAAYTYFGQFIDHDLTFDPSTFQQQKSDPAGMEDYRTPRFDLDSLYGRGPDDQPYLYDGARFLLGERLAGIERNANARDLPRAARNGQGVRRAIIGDPRNDENVIVSQLHGLFLRLHNRLVNEMQEAPFEAIQQEVRWHYQWVVLHDFLPRLVAADVLNDIAPAIARPQLGFKERPRLLLDIKNDRFEQPTMPIEFSVGAYRIGHSMVRSGYRLNENGKPLSALQLLGFDSMKEGLTIDWQRFIDLGRGPGEKNDEDRVQMAYRIDTSLVAPLANLPQSVAGEEAVRAPNLTRLAYRNLQRAKMLRVPTGQEVAHCLSVEPLRDDQILLGPAEDKESPDAKDATPISTIPELRGRCPLWVYVLAEARHNFAKGGGRAVLGPVGGRIVAEVMLSLLLRDRRSFLYADRSWQPRLAARANGAFGLGDLLRYALDDG